MRNILFLLFFGILSSPAFSLSQNYRVPSGTFEWVTDSTWERFSDQAFRLSFYKPWEDQVKSFRGGGFEPGAAFRSRSGSVCLISHGNVSQMWTLSKLENYFMQLRFQYASLGKVGEDRYTLGRWAVRHFRVDTAELVIMKAIFYRDDQSPVVVDLQIPVKFFTLEIPSVNHSFQLIKNQI